MNLLDSPIVSKNLRRTTNIVDPVPPAWYEVTVETAEYRSHQGGRSWISLCYSVDNGYYANSRIFSRVLISGGDHRTQEVSEAILAVLMDSIGLDELTDAEQLVGAKAVVRVIVKDDDRFYKRNEVNFVRGRIPALGATPVPPRVDPEEEDEEDDVSEAKGWFQTLRQPLLRRRG